jgi:hypothetical protein
MQPKTNSIDGINKTTLTQPIPAANLNLDQGSNLTSTSAANPKDKIKPTKKSNQSAMIFITVIVMVVLISLAYLAYHKSH